MLFQLADAGSNQPHAYQVQYNNQYSHLANLASATSLSSSAPTHSETLALIRSSLMNNANNQASYEYATQFAGQTKPTMAVPIANHTSQQQHSHLYGTQSASQNQLILQQRALAIANAKLQQQQQAQQALLRSQQQQAGHYNTLQALGRSQQQQQQQQQQQSQQPQAQQVQYYVTSQNPQNSQYFATLSRHQHAQAQQQYMNSLSSQQQLMQQQQFATLTRHHQQQLQQQQQQQQQQPTLQSGINYSQLLQQRQAAIQQQSQQNPSAQLPSGARIVQMNAGRPIQAQTGAKTMVYSYGGHSENKPQGALPGQPTTTPMYSRKSLVEWTQNDVQEWLQRIGMAEHATKFEAFNGAKLLRLDNNSLTNIGVRQTQHRIYVLEKLKQQIWQNHQ